MNREELIKKYEERGQEAYLNDKLEYYNACKDILYDLRYNLDEES